MSKLTKSIVATVAIGLLLTSTFLTGAQEASKVRNSNPKDQSNAGAPKDAKSADEPSKEEINKALQKFMQDRHIKIREGRNRIAASKNGTTLYAIVRNGKVNDYVLVFPHRGTRGVVAKNKAESKCIVDHSFCVHGCGKIFGASVLGGLISGVFGWAEADECKDKCDAAFDECLKRAKNPNP